MRHYLIASYGGPVYGLWSGETEAHALAAMHEDAGVSVSINERGEMIFACPAQRESAGVVEDWHFTELTADTYDEIAEYMCEMPTGDWETDS